MLFREVSEMFISTEIEKLFTVTLNAKADAEVPKVSARSKLQNVRLRFLFRLKVDTLVLQYLSKLAIIWCHPVCVSILCNAVQLRFTFLVYLFGNHKRYGKMFQITVAWFLLGYNSA